MLIPRCYSGVGGVGGVSSAEKEEKAPIQCLCGQYRWALSNPRRAKLTTYHCDVPSEDLKSKVEYHPVELNKS